MNRKLMIAILGLLLIAALIPWDRVSLWGNKPTDRQATIDSLEAEVDQAKLMNMHATQQLNELSDSLTSLSIIIERTNENYLKLKRQNEKLQKERSALIDRFTDDDIERYLSNRYGK